MFSKIPLLSRFFAVPHQCAGHTLPTANKAGSNELDFIEDSGLASGKASDGDQVIEISDSDDEEVEEDGDVADRGTRGTISETSIPTRWNRDCPTQSSMLTLSVSPILLSGIPDDLTTVVSDLMEVCSEKDDGGDLAPLLPAMFPYKASHEVCKDLRSNSKPCAWMGRSGICLEVVVPQKTNNVEEASDDV